MIKRKGERGARSKIQILHFADEGRRHGSVEEKLLKFLIFQNVLKLHSMIKRSSFSVLMSYHT